MNKINNKVLLGILLVLLLIFLGKRFLGSSDERNFKETLVAIDTSQVNKIVIQPRASGGDNITFTKTGMDWEVASADIKDDADINNVKSMLANMVNMKPKRLVAKSEDKWTQYEVNDSLGTRVMAYAGEKLLTDFILGKFNFQQASRSMSNFVRLGDEEDVYSVEGFLSSSFSQEFNNFRDRTFVKTTKDNVMSIRFEYPADSSFVLSKMGTQWQIGELQADSAAVESYLSGLGNITKNEFADDFVPQGKVATYRLTVSGNNMQAFTVSAFLEGEEYILNSSLNEGAYFEEGSLKIFEKLFVGKAGLLPEEQE